MPSKIDFLPFAVNHIRLELNTMSERIQTHGIAMWLLIACGIWLVELGSYFIFLRPALLPEDTRFMGSSLEQVRAVD